MFNYEENIAFSIIFNTDSEKYQDVQKLYYELKIYFEHFDDLTRKCVSDNHKFEKLCVLIKRRHKSLLNVH